MCLSLAACTIDDGSDTNGGGGESSESSGSAGSSSQSTGGQSSTESAGEAGETSGGGSSDCNGGDACEEPGATCQYADDCGWAKYQCIDGTWQQIDSGGCGADAIPCEEHPQDGDPCDFDPICDPDGDCMDVLECDGYVWLFHDLCSEQYCEQAAPQNGKACDDPDRYCEVATDCGVRDFSCSNGYWDFFGGAICESPQPCSAVPVANDACDTAGEVCEPLSAAYPTLVCDGSTWQPQ